MCLQIHLEMFSVIIIFKAEFFIFILQISPLVCYITYLTMQSSFTAIEIHITGQFMCLKMWKLAVFMDPYSTKIYIQSL